MLTSYDTSGLHESFKLTNSESKGSMLVLQANELLSSGQKAPKFSVILDLLQKILKLIPF